MSVEAAKVKNYNDYMAFLERIRTTFPKHIEKVMLEPKFSGNHPHYVWDGMFININ